MALLRAARCRESPTAGTAGWTPTPPGAARVRRLALGLRQQARRGAGLRALHEPYADDRCSTPGSTSTARIGLGCRALLAAGSRSGSTCQPLAATALDDVAGHPETWGETHVLTPIHAFEVHGLDLARGARSPVSTATSTACACTGSQPGVADDAAAAPSPATSGTLPTATTSGWAVPTRRRRRPARPAPPRPAGAVGRGASCPIVTDWDRLTEETPDARGGFRSVARPDSELVHGWVVEDRARFWMMQDHTVEQVREIYTWIDEQPTHTSWLVRRGDDPVALFQDLRRRGPRRWAGTTRCARATSACTSCWPRRTAAQPGFTAAVVALLAASLFADPDVRAGGRRARRPQRQGGRAGAAAGLRARSGRRAVDETGPAGVLTGEYAAAPTLERLLEPRLGVRVVVVALDARGSRPARTSRSPRRAWHWCRGGRRRGRGRRASASRCRSIRDPSPRRASRGATHIRLISPMPAPICCTPPQATGRPSLVATRCDATSGVRRVAGVEPGREAPVELGEVVRRPPRPPPGRPGRPRAGARSPPAPAGRRSPARRSAGRAAAR